MIKLIKRIWQNRRGNVIIIAGATLPLVIGCAGLATDTIQWTLWKRQLQRAADSAAIAGVYTRTQTDTQSSVEASVCNDLAKNQNTGIALAGTYFTCPDGTTRRGTVSLLADSGSMTKRVSVTLTVAQSLPFSSMFMTAVPQITANSTAASVPGGGSACVQALETNASYTGILFSGNAAIYMPDCDGFSNSPSANTSTAKGSSTVTMNSIGGVGGIQQSNNFHVTAYRPYSPALVDPFAGVTPAPADMACTATTTTTSGNKTTTSTGSVALTENTTLPYVDSTGKTINCFSSLSVASTKTLVLPSGTYYINGGDAFVQGNLSCTKCTIVLTNSSSSATATIGQFKVNASSLISMTAPTSGPFKGIALYQDRRAPDASSNVNKVNGNSNSVIQGAIYFPGQQLEYNGTGTTDAVCTLFVARRVVFTGNSATSNKFKSLAQCSDQGLPNPEPLRIVRLVA